MPSRQTTAKSLVREALLLVACAALPAAAWAARPVPVFQVDVAGQSAPALQQAMRDALVRATGRRESASDPAFGGLIADAPKYVQSYDHGPQGELQVVFNATAVDQAIAAADRSVWDPDRPFTLVVLYPTPDQADQATDQAALEQAAEQRGLPISVVPLPVTDASGNLLPRQALLEMAHRYGAEQLLVGRPPAASVSPTPAAPQGKAPSGAPQAASPAGGGIPLPPRPASAGAAAAQAAARQSAPQGAGDWQWTLYTDFTSQTWSGPLTAGIEDTVDLLAPPAGAAAAGAPGETDVQIEGVTSLDDYANIELMLGAVPGVSRADVKQVSGDSVVFGLTVRGGDATVERALSMSPSFSRLAPAPQSSGPSGAPLVYRYRSG
ncbi:MAG TPA: DUF2066 domain-containing protein [Steroidobacteraceae bacterium]